jgi:hypothetical protein
LLLLIGNFIGWSIRKATFHCPPISTTTVVIHDTVQHNIPTYVPYYLTRVDSIVYRDTVRIPVNIDTVALIKDYFAQHYYTREWQDSLLNVNQVDMVTENKIYPQKFTYVIKRPQTIINNVVDNSVSYSKYIQFGVGVPISNVNYVNVEASYIFPKGYVKAYYMPEIKSFGGGVGVTLFKFKTIKK